MRNSEAEKAWLACAIDSEGLIYFRLTRKGKVVINLKVSNTVREFSRMAQIIAETGYLVLNEQKNMSHKTGKKYRTVFIWLVENQKDILEILQAIEPYLIVKKEKARAVINHILIRREFSPQLLPSTDIFNLCLAALKVPHGKKGS